MANVMRHITKFGTRIAQTQQASEQTACISPATDLNFFVNSVSPQKTPMPSLQRAEPYRESAAIAQLKQQRELAKVRHLLEQSSESAVDKIKQVLFKLLIDCQEISNEETTYALNSVKLPEVREALAAFFNNISRPH